MFRRKQKHSMESAHHSLAQTGLQQHRRCPFFHSTYGSFGNPICFWSVWCWRTMIPGWFLARLCQIPRNCQCKWLLVSSSAPGASLGSSGSPGKFLYNTGMIVSTVLPNLVPPKHIDDCSQNVPLWVRLYQYVFCKTPSLISSSSRYAIWVLRKVRVDTMLTRTRFHFCSRLHWKFMRWLWSVLTSVLWVSRRLCWSTFINQILSEFL